MVPGPERYQPSLRWWSQTWRLLACVVLSAQLWVSVTDFAGDFAWRWLAAELVVGVASFILVLRRRRWPLPVAVVLIAVSGVFAAAAGPAVLATVSLATRRRTKEVVSVVLLNLVAGSAFLFLRPSAPPSADGPVWVQLAATAVFTAAVVAWGLYLGSRRELLWTLRDRAERAETEQELRTANARGDERARIAREMHDALGHRLSQISMHAGALSIRGDLDPAAFQAGAAAIQTRANEALTDLRGVLGVLRDADTGELVEAPQPTYNDVSRLVADARAAGQRIEVVDQLDDTDQIPDSTGRTLYRIVQEALTNARKHAPAALVTVLVSGDRANGIDFVVRNPVGFARTPGTVRVQGSGLGLVGLSERAELVGGRLGMDIEGTTFVLRGWIPWAT